MSDGYDGTERRSVDRTGARGALVAYQKEGFLCGVLGKKKPQRPVPIRNMTSSGACFLCPKALKPGQKLTMRIRLSEKGPSVAVAAEVVWCAKDKGAYPFRAGVKFVDFKGDAWRILSKLEEHVVKRDETSSWGLRLRRGKAQPKEDAPEGESQQQT